MTKSSARNAVTITGYLMLRDIERDGKNKYNDEHMCPNCIFMSKKKEEMEYQVAKKHAQPSSKQSTVCSSCEQFTLLSNNIGERNMEQNNGNLVIL